MKSLIAISAARSLMPKRQQQAEYEEVPLQGGGYKRRRLGAKRWQYMCKHDKYKRLCKECGGASICEHGRQRSRCKECGGASICEREVRGSVSRSDEKYWAKVWD